MGVNDVLETDWSFPGACGKGKGKTCSGPRGEGGGSHRGDKLLFLAFCHVRRSP